MATKKVAKKTGQKVAVKKKAVIKKAVKKTTVKKTDSTKKAVVKKAAGKSVAKKTAKKTAAAVPRKNVSSKKTVTNKKLQGMIGKNLAHASKSKKPVFVDSEIMPQNYGVTSITLLARDPNWVHAYWEVSPASEEGLRQKIGNVVDQCRRVVRIYDTTLIKFTGENANYWFDIDVGNEAMNWYINVWSDNISCCADIGLREPNGTFHMMARSNFVTTPRKHFSPRDELIWMEIKPGQESKPHIYIGAEYGAGALSQEGFRIDLTDEDLRSYYSTLMPMLSKVLKEREGKDGAVGDLSLERLKEIDLMGFDYFKEIILGASDRMVLRRRLLEELLLGAGGASEKLMSSWGASERQVPVKKDFFFELGTELIVYGRTEPDAVVFWGDRIIPLREDGTFTLRMSLPTDTNIPLDFKALSYVKDEQRAIATDAGRGKTEYN